MVTTPNVIKLFSTCQHIVVLNFRVDLPAGMSMLYDQVKTLHIIPVISTKVGNPIIPTAFDNMLCSIIRYVNKVELHSNMLIINK